MTKWLIAGALALTASAAFSADLVRPKAGKVDIFPLKDIRPGLTGTAWTVFEGTEPEPVPIEIVGVWKNGSGPRQDVILAKMGGKAKITNVAAGMSGSPVYIDGKLVGAVALRMSVFSPDAVCGITPIERMLEIPEFDQSRPMDAKTPDKPGNRAVAQASAPPMMMPIDTPLVLSGFSAEAINAFSPFFSQMGVTAVQGGSGAGLLTAKPVSGWRDSLNPGEAVSGILVSGDMSATGMGTVTYNDGKKVLAFGHPFFNLGPLDMPMAKSEILMVLSSAFQPTKFGNATGVVGALHQDRFSGIMGELGAEAPFIPVHLNVRSLDASGAAVRQKQLEFQVFVHQKWTPFLMMLTLYNSLQQMNEMADDITYRMNGRVDVDGDRAIQVSTMLAPSEAPVPAPMALAGWWADKFNRLFLNPVAMPKLKSVEISVDLLPERRTAAIDYAWTPAIDVDAGTEIPVKIFLRPYRGERIERDVRVKIPAGMAKGEQRILFSDADTLNRMQNAAVLGNRYMDIPETISLLNQERGNNQVYVSLVEGRPTYYADDKTLPSLPSSVLNVLQAERTATRALMGTPESAKQQLAIPFDQMISGSYSLRISVK
ncbi:MAG TPA: hypothetical protein VMT15_20135 [Bryobacteraceae bacterium]|nr:hypothetical protein [Bryobacteraceae bacterium]